MSCHACARGIDSATADVPRLLAWLTFGRQSVCVYIHVTVQARLAAGCLGGFPGPRGVVVSQRLLRTSGAVSACPWLANVISVDKRKPLVDRSGHVTVSAAETIARLAHIPDAMCRAAKRGISTVLRVRAFIVRLFLWAQLSAFNGMMASMSRFLVAHADAAEHGAQVAGVVCVTHSWDETKQLLKEPPGAAGARGSKQKVSRNIMVQRSAVRARVVLQEAGAGGRRQESCRAETVVVPPIELYGKSTSWVLAGLQRGCIFPLFQKDAVHLLARTATATVLSFWGDAASSNRRALKHLVGVSQRDAWPPGVMLDVSQVCLLHQVHRVKVQLIEVQNLVSLLFCLSRLVKAGAVLAAVTDFVVRLVQDNCRRVVQPPPANAAKRSRAALDLVLRFEKGHHKRRGSAGLSTLVTDALELLRLDNGGFGGQRLTHYCWDPSTGAPCCADRAETVARLTSAYLDFFVGHTIPTATLSRWTHINTVCSLMCCSYMCRNVFGDALTAALGADVASEEAAAKRASTAATGAGDEDAAHEHRARKSKVHSWISNPGTRLQMGCLLLLVQGLDDLTYLLMGGEQADGQHRRPGTQARAGAAALPAGELVEKVRTVMQRFATHLKDFGGEGSESRLLFGALGMTAAAASSEECVRTLRRRMLGASAGVFRRLSLRLDGWPLRLWLLVEPGVPEEMRRGVAAEFSALPECCAGVFGAALQKLFPTVDRLLSEQAMCVIGTWVESLQWTVYSCEKEHASCRRLCRGEGPGRSFQLLARERTMDAARAVHKERCGRDPGQPRPTRGSKRPAPGQDAAEDADTMQQNVLYDQPPSSPPMPLAWSRQSEQRWSGLPALGDGAPSERLLLPPLADGGPPAALALAAGGVADRALGVEAAQVVAFWYWWLAWTGKRGAGVAEHTPGIRA